MSQPSPPEDDVKATIVAYLQTWWSEPGCEPDAAVAHSLSFIADEFTGLGTGRGDYYPSREAVGELFRRETAQDIASPVSFDVPWMTVRLVRPDLALVECQIASEIQVHGDTHRVDPRASYLLEKTGDRWLITHSHFSTPDAMQEAGATLVETLERRTHVLEREVAERTAELEQSLANLKVAQARLVQSAKMASLGQLTAGIAHEIKNPLNFVTNFAGLSQELVDELDGETDPDERAALLADLKTNAAKIQEHGRRADGIVKAMMAHARSGTGTRRAVDLNRLAHEYAGHAAHAATARDPSFTPTLAFDLADAAPTVEVAPEEIGRVLVNLVDNALGAVRERADDAPPGYAPTVTVATRRVDDRVEIRVTDNGTGMPEAVRAKVFEPFFTTKPTGEGTGLGLSLSHDIVVQGYGGTLSVESVEGNGTTFVVRLPVG